MGKLNDLVRANPPAVVDETAPKTVAHALARATSASALHLGEQEPLGAALRKFSACHDRIGNARFTMAC